MHNMHVISKLSSNHLCAGINKYVSLFIIIIIIILIGHVTKMATFSLQDKDPDDISCVCGLVVPEVEGILLSTVDEDRKKIERELANECDKRDVLEAREKIFGLAKEKVLRCMDDESMNKLLGDACKNTSLDRQSLLRRYVEQWRLVTRRVEHKICSDTMDLLYFVLDRDAIFPGKLVKESSLNKGSLSAKGIDQALAEQFTRDVENKGNETTSVVVASREMNQLCEVNIVPKVTKSQRSVSTVQNEDEEPAPSGDNANEISPTTCARCRRETALRTKGVDKATLTDNVSPARRAVEVGTKATKTYKSMASQTDEETPILRTEFDYHSDYVDRKIGENERKVNELSRWRNVAQGKIKESGQSGRRNAESIKDLAAKQNACNNELDQYKREVEARFFALSEVMEGRILAVESKVAALPADERHADNIAEGMGDDESVWDIPDEQSCPEERYQDDPSTQPAMQMQQTSTQKPTTRGRPNAVVPAADRRNPMLQNRARSSEGRMGAKKSYKLDIEIVDSDSEDAECARSAGTEQVTPDGKRRRRDGYDTEGSSYGRGRDDTAGRQSNQAMAAIEEERDWSDDGEQHDDGPWSDIAEDNEGGYTGDTVVNRKSGPNTNGNGRDRSSNGDRRIVVSRAAPNRSNTRGESYEVVGGKHEPSNGGGQTVSAESYAGAAGKPPKYDWSIADGKGRKRKVDERRHSLKGIKTISQRDVYVQGIDYRGLANYTEVENEVKGYCKDNGISLLFIKVIPVKLDNTQVGCKISVKEEDFDRIMSEEFWPEFVTVRPWVFRPKDGRGNGGANA